MPYAVQADVLSCAPYYIISSEKELFQWDQFQDKCINSQGSRSEISDWKMTFAITLYSCSSLFQRGVFFKNEQPSLMPLRERMFYVSATWIYALQETLAKFY